jgi:methionyl-tRNA formyltransferase
VELWRVVIISQVGDAAASIDRVVREAGHAPVAVLTTRRAVEEGPKRERFFLRVFSRSPRDLDILVPANSKRIAPLLESYEPDLVVCCGFPWLIPAQALAVPRLGAINIHPSLLPRWRGPFPVAWAVRCGEDLGSTVHRMDANYDTGPILAQGSLPFENEWSWEELGPKLEALEAKLLRQALERLAAGDEGEPQPATDDPYAGEFEDDYVWVDWSKSVEEVLRQIRAWQFVGVTRQRERGPLAKIRGETLRVLRAGRGGRGLVEIECANGPVDIEAVESPTE